MVGGGVRTGARVHVDIPLESSSHSIDACIAIDIANENGFKCVHPTLPWLDHFLLSSAGLLPYDEAIGAFVRAGLHRSFTARKV
jgi:hypothetical protein